jgi:hypothetical protein
MIFAEELDGEAPHNALESSMFLDSKLEDKRFW